MGAMAEDAMLLLVVPLVASSVCGILARRLGFSAIAGYILGSGLVVVAVLIVFFFAGRAALRATRRLEETFELS